MLSEARKRMHKIELGYDDMSEEDKEKVDEAADDADWVTDFDSGKLGEEAVSALRLIVLELEKIRKAIERRAS